MDRRDFIRKTACVSGMVAMAQPLTAAMPVESSLNIGIIGLDTSHSPAFTKLITDPKNPLMKNVRVVCAYPYGSTRIEASASRIPQFTKEIEALGVTVVDSIDSVIASSDAIMLMTTDGSLHYEQILPVLKAGKKIFLNKPFGANLSDVIRIYDLIHQYQVPVFSSSALRYLEGAQKVRYQNAVGKLIGAEAYSPQKNESTHTDLFWYGIHGVEILYTMMGTGCERVKRMTEKEQDIVIGRWKDGRIGTYRGDLQTRQFYGGTAYGTDSVLSVGPFNGYDGLVNMIVKFFKDGIMPVDELETLEIYTFMEAADESKKQGGAWVKMKALYDKEFQRARQ
jgi:predicted dehydrogenase